MIITIGKVNGCKLALVDACSCYIDEYDDCVCAIFGSGIGEKSGSKLTPLIYCELAQLSPDCQQLGR